MSKSPRDRPLCESSSFGNRTQGIIPVSKRRRFPRRNTRPSWVRPFRITIIGLDSPGQGISLGDSQGILVLASELQRDAGPADFLRNLQGLRGPRSFEIPGDYHSATETRFRWLRSTLPAQVFAVLFKPSPLPPPSGKRLETADYSVCVCIHSPSLCLKTNAARCTARPC